MKTEQYEESRAALERERMLMEKRNQEIEVESSWKSLRNDLTHVILAIIRSISD